MGEDEFFVEEILAHKKTRDGGNQYLLKYFGYDAPEWTSEDNIPEGDMIRKFKRNLESNEKKKKKRADSTKGAGTIDVIVPRCDDEAGAPSEAAGSFFRTTQWDPSVV